MDPTEPLDPQSLYETVYEATRQALTDERGGSDIRLSRRMVGGRVIFEDGEGRLAKEIETHQLFRKVTAVREKLRVLEQKINNHDALSIEEKAELQVYVTRSYGSLTTFNFLFREDDDKFKGQSG